MACLDMYNSEHKGLMSPRLSFSNDFAESQHIKKQERNSREAPVSLDFEFSVTNYSMMSADELFFKGKLLPFKEKCNNQMQRTLREELLVNEDKDVGVSPKSPRVYSNRWKWFLGLRRSHIGTKKAEKSDGSAEKVAHETKTTIFAHEENLVSKSSQEILSEGGSSCRDLEIGI